ncbi:MAG TPA: bifunctional (p)ppGpp synthetase/guanosine-3',5'-bis(diphosphate) 3'-pyrophosphohydrolase [Mollicutes bacterium]|nr:bifunctional (p)ppGpp synthetase/guanosine-3',5'-bis(diphosphate) 3'-pyrophosphohydrolase [Mollicutes bacterium]
MGNKLFQKLLFNIKKYIKDESLIKMIINAYLCADILHAEQKRQSGEEYIVHPISVALILSEYEADADTIAAALLHDVIEDTSDINFTKEDIATIFNDTVASLVDGVTKINKLNFSSKEEAVATNNRKIIMSLNEDIRMLLIKLADRLHNMRTLQYLSEFKQKENSLETMELYVPLAYYIGAFKMKNELVDLSLRYLKPDMYRDMELKLTKIRQKNNQIIGEMLINVSTILSNEGIPHEIKMRIKNICGIYNKMLKKKNITDIQDLLALKVIVENVKDCYFVLGLIHSIYKPIDGKFKDYIASPKTNMYSSLHTTVVGRKGQVVQCQIRTFDMDEIAYQGLMSYWKKYGNEAVNYMREDLRTKFQFFQSLSELDKITADNQEFLLQAKRELFSDNIYVYTPKGEIIELPNGSTPIDFAYRINKNIGNTMIGALINDKYVDLDYKLKNKDIVKIVTDDMANPSLDWIDKADTTYAKREINKFYTNKKVLMPND